MTKATSDGLVTNNHSSDAKTDIKFTSPIVIKLFFILLAFNIANDMLSELIKKNKIIIIKEYYNYSLKNLVDMDKVDNFVKVTSDMAEEISRIDEFILEGNILSYILNIIQIIIRTLVLYIFSFFLTKYWLRIK